MKLKRIFKNFVSRFKKPTVSDTLKEILSCEWFPVITALITLIGYYTNLDIALIIYFGIILTAMILLLDDLTPVIPQALFMNIMVSYKHSPLQQSGYSDYYTKPAILAIVIIVISVIVVAMALRLFFTAKNKNYKPSSVFWGLAALAVVFLINGLGSHDYNPMNFVFGLFMAFFFFALFTLFASSITLCDENYRKICIGFVLFSAVLIIELAVKYVTKWNEIFADGGINKSVFVFGWGVWGHIGTYFAISIPPVFLLAHKSKYSYLYILYATLLFACAFLTGSRNGMMGAVIAYAASYAVILIKGRNRLYNLCVLGGLLVVALILFLAMREKFAEIFKHVWDAILNEDGTWDGNGRMRLIEVAMKCFAINPFFGTGFFSGDFDCFPLNGLTGTIIPTWAHDTFAEMIATSGMIGLLAYLVHRIQTIIAFAEKPTVHKSYIAISLVALLVICLFDNFIFYMLPTIVYSGLLPFVTGTECKPKALLPQLIKKRSN